MERIANGRRRARTSLVTVALVGALAATGACAPAVEVTVLQTTVVTWSGDDGATDGQVIVRVRNASDRHVDPDILGRGRQTSARLLDAEGKDVPGGDALVQLHAAPAVLAPGEEGYLLGAFSLGSGAPAPADARVEINADDVDPPPEVDVHDFGLTEEADGIGAEGRLAWDDSGTAVVRVVALDDSAQPLGYAGTAEVLYSSGPFTLCCLPPGVTLDAIDEVEVHGSQAHDDG